MYIIDSNIHLHNLLKKYIPHPSLDRVINNYQSIPTSERVSSELILSEVEIIINKVLPRKLKLNKKQRRINRSISVLFIQQALSQFTIATIDRKTSQLALELFMKQDNNSYISLVDCTIISLALEHRYSIVSLDKRLIEKAESLGAIVYKE